MKPTPRVALDFEFFCELLGCILLGLAAWMLVVLVGAGMGNY